MFEAPPAPALSRQEEPSEGLALVRGCRLIGIAVRVYLTLSLYLVSFCLFLAGGDLFASARAAIGNSASVI